MAKENLIRDEDRIPIMNTLLLKHESDRKMDGKNDWSYILEDFQRPDDQETELTTVEISENLKSKEELKNVSSGYGFFKLKTPYLGVYATKIHEISCELNWLRTI